MQYHCSEVCGAAATMHDRLMIGRVEHFKPQQQQTFRCASSAAAVVIRTSPCDDDGLLQLHCALCLRPCVGHIEERLLPGREHSVSLGLNRQAGPRIRSDPAPRLISIPELTTLFLRVLVFSGSHSQRVHIHDHYELGPNRPSLLWFWGPNSIIVVYMDPLG